MLKMCNFEAKNIKIGKVDKVSAFVRYLVRTSEFTKVRNKMKKSVDLLELSHPGDSALSMDEKVVKTTLGIESGEKFISNRKEFFAILEELAALPDKEEYDALQVQDKYFLTMLAHTIDKTIVLDKSILPSGLDELITAFYEKGSVKGARETLRSTFNRLCGEDGFLFYGIRFSRKDFEESDIRRFMSFFTKGAERPTDKKSGVIGKYDFRKLDDSVKVQADAVTTLFSVVICSRLETYEKVPTVKTAGTEKENSGTTPSTVEGKKEVGGFALDTAKEKEVK